MKKRSLFFLVPLLLIAVPFGAHSQATVDVAFSEPYAFKRHGIFGCSIDGAYSMSVGSLAAVGGVYVPVNDAAVTLNTGYLVYKECVLRGVVNRQREAVTAESAKKTIVDYSAARNGNPMWSQLIPREQNDVLTKYVVDTLQGTRLDTLGTEVKDPVKRAIVRRYSQSLNAPTQNLGCTYAGNVQAVYRGAPTEDVLGSLSIIGSPCNPIIAYPYANEFVLGGASAAVDDLMTKLNWGDGNYPVDVEDENGDPITVTPGNIVSSNVIQALQTGFRQQENANDIDQMVGALFGSMASQVIGDTRGLLGLTQRTGSQPSYLDQVVRTANQGVRTATTNAALGILAGAKAFEQRFFNALRAIATHLTGAATALRNGEKSCWEEIVDRVCTTALTSAKKCTATSGETLRVATSTRASQAVIDAAITPSINTTRDSLEQSQEMLDILDRLIAGASNSDITALAQLDTLVAQRRLHGEGDATRMEQAIDPAKGRMDTLITDTLKLWSDRDDLKDATGDDLDGDLELIPGWCKYTEESVLEKWIQKWKE